MPFVKHFPPDLDEFIRVIDELGITVVTVGSDLRVVHKDHNRYSGEVIKGDQGVLYQARTRFRHEVEYFEPGMESTFTTRGVLEESESQRIAQLIGFATAHDRVQSLHRRRPDLTIHLLLNNRQYADEQVLKALLAQIEEANLKPLPFPGPSG